MSKVQQGIQRSKTFFGDVVAEMKKTAWPPRQELIESTVMVIVLVVMVAAYVGVSDKLLVTLLRLLVPAV